MESPRVVSALLLLALLVGSSGIILKVEGAGVCNMSSGGLLACRPSVSGWSPKDPSPECCAAVAGADFGCFCAYRKSPFVWLYGINFDRVKKLPAMCDVNRPLPDC